MNNLPIFTNNNPASKTANTSSPSHAATAKGTSNAAPAGPFAQVLSRQMDAAANATSKAHGASKPNPAAADALTVTDPLTVADALTVTDPLTAADALTMTDPLAAADPLTVADPLNAANKTSAEIIPAPPALPGDPSSALAAMMKLSQNISTPVTTGASTGVPVTSGEPGGRTSVDVRIAANFITAPGKRETEDKSSIAIKQPTTALAGMLTQVDSKKARVTSDADVGKTTEQVKELPSAIQNAQNAAATAASMASSGIHATTFNGKASSPMQGITSPVGSSAWPDEFSQKISWMSTQKNQIAELHLNPPDLGPLNVVLKISDNQATVLFTSPHSAVREAIENAMPRLRDVLADNGIMLGNATVNDQTPRDSGANGFTDQRARTQSGNDMSNAGTPDSTLTSVSLNSARIHNGIVDTFA